MFFLIHPKRWVVDFISCCLATPARAPTPRTPTPGHLGGFFHLVKCEEIIYYINDGRRLEHVHSGKLT